MSENMLSKKGEGKRSILPIIEGSTGLIVRFFPWRGKIDGIFDVFESITK